MVGYENAVTEHRKRYLRRPNRCCHLTKKRLFAFKFQINPAAIGWLKYERVIDYAINFGDEMSNISPSRESFGKAWRSSMTPARITFSDVTGRGFGLHFWFVCAYLAILVERTNSKIISQNFGVCDVCHRVPQGSALFKWLSRLSGKM